MEDLKINDDQITASSVLQPHKPYYGRLNLISFYDDIKKSAWCSDDDDKEPYLTIDLKSEKTISGVAVQGASVYDSFVTSYKLCYSDNGRKYDCVKHNGTTEVCTVGILSRCAQTYREVDIGIVREIKIHFCGQPKT